MSNHPDLYPVTSTDFASRVLDLSHARPVLVDFWAAWCGPCRSIAPLLEQLLRQFDGKLSVAKVDTDAEAELAGRYGVRSLPTLAVFRNGTLVEQLVGAHPLQALVALVSRHLVRESELKAEEARAALAAGNRDVATRLLAEAVAADPEHYVLYPDYAACLIDSGALDEAAAVMDLVPARAASEALSHQQARLRFARLASGSSDSASLAARISSGAVDSDTRFHWAVQQMMAGDYASGLETLLQVVRSDRAYGEDAARKLMLDVFSLLPAGDPLIREYRSQLARALN